jgi:hypothetical protein
MQSVKEFINAYFMARTEQFKQEIQFRLPFRKKFFSEDCVYDRRESSIEWSMSEIILEIIENDKKFHVTTTRMEPYTKLRYHIGNKNGKWLIELVENTCPVCNGVVGPISCDYCGDNGWVGGKTLKNTLFDIEKRFREKEGRHRR